MFLNDLNDSMSSKRKVQEDKKQRQESLENGKSIQESDISGLLHAARHYNRSFIFTVKTAEGTTKKFRIKAQSERAARERVALHMSQALVLDVQEENMDEAKEAEYGADWDAKVQRLNQLAKEGPRKTVWDPVKRVYKTVPVNQSKQEQGVAEGYGEDDGIHMGAKVYHRAHQSGSPFTVIGIVDDQRVKVVDEYGNKKVLFIDELVPVQSLAEDATGLNIGDPVVITGDVQFKGTTGEVVDFGRDNHFVVVNLYNHGKHSFHSSDVSYNDYVDREEDDGEDVLEMDSQQATGRMKADGTRSHSNYGNRDHETSGPDITLGRDSMMTNKDANKFAGDVLDKEFKQARGVSEAKGLSKKVKVIKGKHAGCIGWIREIKTSGFKGGPKTYFVDLENGTQLNNVPGTALRLVKDDVAEGMDEYTARLAAQQAAKKSAASQEAKVYKQHGITARKAGGDDANSWAIFINGRMLINGLSKREVPHYMKEALKRVQQKQGMAEAGPETTFNILKGLKSWQVVIMNNFYRGKYSDYSGRFYYVLASSPEEARQVVLDNADAILQDLLSMNSINGRKILPRSKAIRITDKQIGDIKDGTEAGRMTTASYKKMFGPQGPMMVKLSNGAIADVQGQEQGVTEGSNDTVYPNAEVIKSKNGKPVGEIYQDDSGWGCFHYKADRGYDGIDSREDAIQALKELHQERSRPDYTIKGVAEHIVKVGSEYELKSKKTGKNLGKYPTKAGAEKRERQVQYFKHAGESVEEDSWHGEGDEWHGAGDQWSGEQGGGGAAGLAEGKRKLKEYPMAQSVPADSNSAIPGSPELDEYNAADPCQGPGVDDSQSPIHGKQRLNLNKVPAKKPMSVSERQEQRLMALLLAEMKQAGYFD